MLPPYLTLSEQGATRLPAAKIDAGGVIVLGGLSPGNEDNEAGGHFGPEKPCCPSFTEGTFSIAKKRPQCKKKPRKRIPGLLDG